MCLKNRIFTLFGIWRLVMNKSGAYMGRNDNPSIIEDGKSVLKKRLVFLKDEINLENPFVFLNGSVCKMIYSGKQLEATGLFS